jgi:excisionase family DNA binding protein
MMHDNSKPLSPLVLTIDQVAELLQVAPSVVGRLRNQRKIAYVKIGGALRFHLPDIEDYIRRAKQPCQNLVSVSKVVES